MKKISQAILFLTLFTTSAFAGIHEGVATGGGGGDGDNRIYITYETGSVAIKCPGHELVSAGDYLNADLDDQDQLLFICRQIHGSSNY